MLSGCTPWPETSSRRYREKALWLGRDLGTLLGTACGQRPGRTAVVDDRGARLSYGDLLAGADAVGQRLLGEGIRPGERVVVQLPNVAELLVLLVGMFRVGVIPVLALPGHRRSEIEHLVRTGGAVAYVTVDESRGFDHRSIAREMVHDLGIPALIVGDGADLPSLSCAAVPGGTPGGRPHVDASDPALFLLSGGTTGAPKLIPRTHDDYAYNALVSAEVLGIGADDVFLAVNPVAHNAALGCPGALGTLLRGGTVVLSRSTRPSDAFDLIEAEGVTFTIVVPAIARMWCNEAHRRSVSFPGLLVQIGSAMVTETQVKALYSALGCEVSQMFGVGEGLLTCTRRDDPPEVIQSTVGRPVSAEDEIRIVDDDGEPVEAGVVGELLVRGPYTIRGYYRAAERNAESFTADGFFRTGDLVLRREDGNLVMMGRRKEVINRGGDKVSSAELEGMLGGHPAVHDVAVIGAPSASLGEQTVAFVVTDASDEATAPRLKEYLRGLGLATFKIPDQFRAVAGLPRTPVGKADKTALRASLDAEGGARRPAPSPATGDADVLLRTPVRPRGDDRPDGRPRAFHRSVPGFAPTRLVDLAPLAAELDVSRVVLKDESSRLGLPSFKALGASWAVHQIVRGTCAGPGDPVDFATLREMADGVRDLCLVAATEGNHGRAVARFARLLGLRAHVVVPAAVDRAAIEAIGAEGAEVEVVETGYDEAVVRADAVARSGHRSVLVQDTAWPGYEQVPGDIVDGYSTMFLELDEQLAEAGVGDSGVLLVPAGVGSLAQAAVTHCRRAARRGTSLRVVAVEPSSAACVQASLRAGEMTTVPTPGTRMHGLDCGTPSSLAWSVLRDGLDAAVAVDDEHAAAAAGDLRALGVSTGPCGAASLAGARRLRQRAGLGAGECVVLLNTEASAA